MPDLPRDPECWPEPWRSRYAERAAMYAAEGGMRSIEADARAKRELEAEWFQQFLAAKKAAFTRQPRASRTSVAVTER